MRPGRIVRVVAGNVRRNKRAFVLSSIGLIVGVGTFTFFVALGFGIQQGVLNRIYPVNQIEIEPASVGVVGLREQVVEEERLGPEMVETLEDLRGVVEVYPKMRSRVQARIWGGKALFGYNMRAEAFFDGLPASLLHEELKRREGVADGRRRDADAEARPCRRDEECPLGRECRGATGESEGRCRPIEYWRRFVHRSIAIPCGDEGAEAHCPRGTRCVAGRCRTPCGEGDDEGCGEGERCVAPPGCEGDDCARICLEACERDGDCPETHACTDAGACRRLACELEDARAQYSDRPNEVQGRVRGRCANRVDPSSPACEPMPCPGESYCAARDPTTARGWCEYPLPVVLSPFLIEMFNSSVASSLDVQPVDGTEAVLGLRFRMHLGGSFFTGDKGKRRQSLKLAEIVGFSDKALDFGVTMPLPYVRAVNTRFEGREAARTYSSFILETEGNEDVSRIIAEVDERGFSLSRQSRDARKAADMLFILTVVFSFISMVIMGVAAVNITHTFLMIVTERRQEIGIMRALGATRGDVRGLILGEACAIGLFGAVVGEIGSWGFSRLVNAAAHRYLDEVPFKPEDFFAYDWRILAGGMLFALVFCVLGAFAPAQRAARLDPARVLTS